MWGAGPVRAAGQPASRSAASVHTAVERFAGVVRCRESFERAVFGNLRFRLVPTLDTAGCAAGWDIRLYGPDTLQNFAGIATPPYHGVNHLQVEAWHFRNRDNTGANQGEVNAPQEERWFSFVTRPGDYRSLSSALDIVLWPNGRAQPVVDSAMAALDSVPKGEGRLLIRDMKLGNLGPGLTPWFEFIRFEVALRPPTSRPR